MHRPPNVDEFAYARLEQDEPRSPFDLKVFVLYAALRFRAQIVLMAITGISLGLLVAAAQPNVYSVLAKLRFEPSARQVMSEEAAFGVESGDVNRFRASTAVEEELELLRDPVIYERVVEAIGATEILRVADPRSGDGPGTSLPVRFMHSLQAGLIHFKGLDNPCPDGETPEAIDAAVKALLANTKLIPIRRTNIIDIKYSDSSPAKVKVVADELLVQMRMRHLEEYQATKQLEMLRTQKKEAFQELQAAQKQLKEYQAQCGFWDLDTDKVACQEALREADAALDELDRKRQMLNGQILSLETDLNLRSDDDRTPGEPGEEGSEGRSYSLAYKKALQDLAAVQAKLTDLERTPDPGELTLKRIERTRSHAETIRKEIDSMNPYGGDPILAELGANTDPAIAEAKALLAGYRADRLGVKSQMEAVTARLETLENRRALMAECEANYTRFKSVATAADSKFSRFSESEGNLASLAIMDEEERSNLSVFRAARLPRDKDGPQRSKALIMGLAAGLAFGLGLAILRQVLDRRVRYQETIENSLGLRVLCVVPDLSRKVGFDLTKGAA